RSCRRSPRARRPLTPSERGGPCFRCDLRRGPRGAPPGGARRATAAHHHADRPEGPELTTLSNAPPESLRPCEGHSGTQGKYGIALCVTVQPLTLAVSARALAPAIVTV